MEPYLCVMATDSTAAVGLIIVVLDLAIPQLDYLSIVNVAVTISHPEVHVLSVGPVVWVMLDGAVGESVEVALSKPLQLQVIALF